MEGEVYAFLDHFESALRYISDHPKALIRDVELINDLEMRQIIPPQTGDLELHADNIGFSDRVSHVKNMSELIELQVERTPHKIAVSFIDVARLVILMVS